MTYKEINNIMKPWRYLYLDKSEERLHFIRWIESDDCHEMITAVNSVFTALWEVMRPLEVNLTIAAKQRGSSIIDKKIPVPVSSWYLYEMYFPARVELARGMDPSTYNEGIPELTPQALTDWLTRAHAQQLPEGYVPRLTNLYVNSTRARLLQDQEPYAELTWRCDTNAIPVEKREDGLWVSGPMQEGMIMHPPITIELSTYQVHPDYPEELLLNISVNWSPWIEAGSAEEELFLACLLELEKHGWEAD